MAARGRITLLAVLLVFVGASPGQAQLRDETTTKPKAPPAVRLTQIIVETSANAEVRLDGQLAGRASAAGRLVISDAKPGIHTLRVTSGSSESYEPRFKVVAGRVNKIAIALTGTQLVVPPELKLPQMPTNTTRGDPQGGVGPATNGPGFGGGIGSGEGTGIGSGRGDGFGGGAYSVGGNVKSPVPYYKPEPAYSEEARQKKYQGIAVLLIVIDAQGNVTDARVVKPLGLGLDEKALEAVFKWKFRPGTRNGVPVAVKVMVEMNFRLF